MRKLCSGGKGDRQRQNRYKNRFVIKQKNARANLFMQCFIIVFTVKLLN